MRNHSLIFWLLFFVHGVFGADEVKSVSVMVGDSITLHTDDTETRGAEKLQWKIQGENTFIAIIDREINETSVPGNDEERFSGRLNVNNTTGSLTITNLKTTDTRVYELQIKTSRVTTLKIFKVTVRDEMKTVSVKKGDPVTLDTGLIEIKGNDLILWMSEGHVMAEMNRTTNRFSLFRAEGKFEGRLQRDQQTGSLIIYDSRSTDSGVYHLNMSSSTYTLQRTISVTVTDVPVTDVPVTGQDLTTQKTLTGIIVVLVLVLVAVIIGFVVYWKKQQRQNPRHWVPWD